MEKYVTLLLFVVPGFLARTLISKFDNKDDIKSELEKTLISLLYGLPIWFLSILLLKLFTCFNLVSPINNIEEFKNSLQNINFLLTYTGITLVATFIFVIISLIYTLKFQKNLTNKIRKKLKLPELAKENNGWKEFFKESNEKVIGIYKGKDEKAIGILKNNSINNDKRSEIILEKVSLIEDSKDFYKTIDRVYIDLEKDITIKEFILNENKDE